MTWNPNNNPPPPGTPQGFPQQGYAPAPQQGYAPAPQQGYAPAPQQGYGQPQMPPQAQGTAPLPPLEALFPGFQGATSDAKNPKLLDEESATQQAQFRLKWISCEMAMRDFDGSGNFKPQFLLETEVVQTSHPERGPGQLLTITENKLGDTRYNGELQRKAMGLIKSVLAAALSHKLGRPIREDDPSQDWNGVLKMVIDSRGELLRGCEFMADAEGKRAQNGNWRIEYRFRHVPELYGQSNG